MNYVITHSAIRTTSERFRRRHLYLAASITAELEAVSTREFRSMLLSLDVGLCLLSLSIY